MVLTAAWSGAPALYPGVITRLEKVSRALQAVSGRAFRGSSLMDNGVQEAITCLLYTSGARLAVFDIAELREVTAYDELELDTLGDRKTALFRCV